MRNLALVSISILTLACGGSAVAPDASSLDAAAPDSGRADAGSTDGGPADAGRPTDAGPPDAFRPPDDAGTEEDACVPPPCPAPPEGCHYEGFTLCTCGTLVCPPSTCEPACGLDEYCDVCDGGCKARPEDTGGFCPGVYDPVCGCDGQTYSNTCRLESAGIPLQHEGECGGSSEI